MSKRGNLEQGSPGASGGPREGPWGSSGVPREAFWLPRSDPDDGDAHSRGSKGGYRSTKNSPESVFLRSKRVKVAISAVSSMSTFQI